MHYGINVLKFKPENIVVFEPTEWSRDLIAILDKNITTVSSTDSIPNMKFTHSLINPPYQAEGLKNAGKTQWDKFIPVVENVVVDGGWMNHVHPSAWRKPGHTLNRLFEYQFHKLSIHSDTGDIMLTATDKKNDTSNNYSVKVGGDATDKFDFHFKTENLKLIEGDYDVSISSKNISHFKHKSKEIQYWIALEQTSTFN